MKRVIDKVVSIVGAVTMPLFAHHVTLVKTNKIWLLFLARIMEFRLNGEIIIIKKGNPDSKF